MSEVNLPEGWIKTVLGDYLYVKNGYAFKSKNYVAASVHTFPVIRISDLDGQSATDINALHVEDGEEGFEVKNGDLLIAMSGATTGKIGVYKGKEPAYQNQRVGNLKLHSEAFGCNQYKNLLISALRDRILRIAYGGAQPNISGKAIEEIAVALPPLAEQKLIAYKLDSMLAKIETTKARLERIPEILKTLRQSVLAAAVSGKLTEKWRVDKDYTEWSVIKLEKLITASANGLSKRSGKDGEETRILRLADFKDASRVYGKERKIKLNAKEIEKYSLINGDILIIRVNGSVDLAGKFIRYEKTEEIEGFCDHFIRLRLDQGKILSKYLTYVANEGIGRLYLQNSLSTSAGQNTINQGSVKDLDVPLPSLKEQAQIVRRVEELFALADTIDQKANVVLEQINRLSQSIVAKAFRGELTADWRTANQELISGVNSAKTLLEKIKEERQKLKPARKARTQK